MSQMAPFPSPLSTCLYVVSASDTYGGVATRDHAHSRHSSCTWGFPCSLLESDDRSTPRPSWRMKISAVHLLFADRYVLSTRTYSAGCPSPSTLAVMAIM